MNPQLEQELEKEIGRLLRGQSDLAAPTGLLARTMNAIERPSPWYLRSWSQWPVPIRIGFLFVALATVAVAVMGWRAVEPSLLAATYRGLAPAVSGLKCFWDVLSALASAVALEAEHLGGMFMLACVVAVLGASAACAGFGTIFVRLAGSRSEKNQI